MFKKIFLAVLIGILGTIFFAQYDVWMHKKIIKMMQYIAQESLIGRFTGTVQSVNFFLPSLILQDVEMKSIESESWQWRCKKIEVTASWLQLLFRGNLEQYIVVEGLECRSSCNGSRIAIESHLMSLLNPPSLPFIAELKSIVFKKSYLTIFDENKNIDTHIWFNCSSLRIGKTIKTTISLQDGYISYENNKYIEKIALDVSLSSEFISDHLCINAHMGGTCIVSHLSNCNECYFNGTWNNDRGRFSIRNAYNSFIIDPVIITEKEIRLQGHLPLSYVVQFMRNSSAKLAIDGALHCSIKIDKKDLYKIDGEVIAEDIIVNKLRICDVVKIIFNRYNTDWKTQLIINRAGQECKASCIWHEKEKRGELRMNNSTDLYTKALNYWCIRNNNFFLHATMQEGLVEGNYEATATHILNETKNFLKGSFVYNTYTCMLQGLIDDNSFSIEAALYPECILNHCTYKDKCEKELIALKTDIHTKEIQGFIAFPFIRSVLNKFMQYDIQGEGGVSVAANVIWPDIIADITLKDATIRLPQTYNFIDGFKSHCVYNFLDTSLICNNIDLSLHTGKVHCVRAVSRFDSHGSLITMHMPFIFEHCLLNIKKDLFAIVSGHLLFSKSSSSGQACVDGYIFLDKAQLKENLFSNIIQKQLLSYTHSFFYVPAVPLHCNIALQTTSAIVIDTGFLNTHAHIDLKIKKEKDEPFVIGSILLHSGTLNFPYKPLYISKGVITFSPEQLYDPVVEFIARNKIKKYDVSLQVEGSLLTHQMSLDATPPLSEEQIVGLLLVGSEENSLNSMMPALLVQNLKNLIFSNNQLSFFDKYFKPLLGTFNIKLVPSFTDQTGRGGLRGALEITVDDQWRAVIQKNFSLTEDTKFELEYLFSDDITFRAIRDERRDLGGEVEMRWKF